MNSSEIKSRLEKQFSGIQIQIINEGLVIKPEDLLRVAKFLKESDEFKMNYLSSVTAVDYLEFLESVYHLYSVDKRTGPVAPQGLSRSLERNIMEGIAPQGLSRSLERNIMEGIVLKVRVPRDKAIIPSLVPLFRGAEFQEREAYDMMGIVYEGHPDPRRIFMWEGFEGYPMRKDYIPEDADVLEMEDVEWLERHHVTVPIEYKEFAKQLKASGKEARAQRPTEKEPA